MEFLIFWLGTSVASIGLAFANELRVFKDIADAGYKIDINKFSELGKQIDPQQKKITLLSMLIPMYNLMTVLQSVINYNNRRSYFLDSLHVMNILEEMSEIEKKEYLKKPTGLNALFVLMNTEVRLRSASVIRIENDTEKSEIFFEIGKSVENIDDITILKVNGDASKLTTEEQKQKVVDAMIEGISIVGMEKCDEQKNSMEQLVDDNNLNCSLDVKEIKPSGQTKSFNIKEQKEMLEKLKNDLLEVQAKEKEKQKSLNKNDMNIGKRK